jgi:hypothetical protein
MHKVPAKRIGDALGPRGIVDHEGIAVASGVISGGQAAPEAAASALTWKGSRLAQPTAPPRRPILRGAPCSRLSLRPSLSRYAGQCVGLYYTCINSYPTPEKPRPGPMSSAVLRRVPNRVRRRLFAGGLEGTGFELLVRRVCELLVPKRRSPICSSFKIMRPEPLHRVASQSIALGVVLV